MSWVSLHNHSQNSLLDGYSKPKDMVTRCKELGYNACALTDHGTISGCVAFYKACKEGGIKAILGCEFYFVNNAKEKNADNKGMNHVVILSKNLTGWYELIQCVSESNKEENFYHKPRIDYDMMKKFLGNGNHICFSGHPGTVIAETLFTSNAVFDAENIDHAYSFLREDWKESVKTVVQNHVNIFGSDFFLEIQLIDKDRLYAAQIIANCLREVAAEMNIATVATGDSHYVRKSDAIYQRILLCSALNKTLPEIEKGIANRDKVPLKCFFVSDNYHIPTPEEIAYLHTEEEINNAQRIADLCEDYDILNKPSLPKFSCPNNISEIEYLKELCRIGWKNKLTPEQRKDPVYIDRIKEELAVIEEADLSGYFLIVQDIVNWVRLQGWLPGPGRGSAAGCLISYLIGITRVDPIPYNLLFSRFYNSSRKGSLPDIDVDVPAEHRDEIIEYIKDKYGRANVSQMATFGRLQGRSALKEVMRVEDSVSFAEMNEITKALPNEAEIADELEEMDSDSIILWALINTPKKLEKWCKLNEDGSLSGDLSDIFQKAIAIEGTYKSKGKHAAGVIISAKPLAEVCPMARDRNGDPMADFEMGDLEAVGQVKLDILGVDILSKIMKVAEDKQLNINDFYDNGVWSMLSSGDTKGVFQLESQLGKSWAKRLKPRNIEELSALIALIRPGCLEAFFEGKSMTQHYIDRKHGLEEVKYFHPSLEPILKDTYGVLVYQEQSMIISREIAGFSLEEADTLRKAMGKKLPELMAKVKKDFLEGCKKVGKISEEEAAQIFDWIEASQRYSFNKSHSVSYAINGFNSAYCKYHNLNKFYEVYLDHARRKQDTQLEIKELINDAKIHNIEILPPRLNHLYINFKNIEDRVYFGISNIKDVGETECKKIESLISNINMDQFTWMDILCNFADVINKRAFVAMISTGCLNGSNNRNTRNQMLYDFDNWKNLTVREKSFIKENLTKNKSLLYHIDLLINNFKIAANRLIQVIGIKQSLEKPMYDLNDEPTWIAQIEEKYFGASLTCSKTDFVDSNMINSSCKDIFNNAVRGNANIAVQINTVREYKIKSGKSKGQTMAFLSVEDSSAALDSVIIFPDTYIQFKPVLYEGNTVIIMGRPSNKRDGSLIIDKVCQI